jgi:hypothetical protein
MVVNRTLGRLSICLLIFSMGCPSPKQNTLPAPPLIATCTVQVDRQYVMTNPISINPKPTLNAKTARFAPTSSPKLSAF